MPSGRPAPFAIDLEADRLQNTLPLVDICLVAHVGSKL